MTEQIGLIVGEGTSIIVDAFTEEPEPVGKYVLIGDELGVITHSTATSRALSNVKNFNEATKAINIPLNTTRDRSYQTKIEIIGNASEISNGIVNRSSKPIVPGTPVSEVDEKILQKIFGPESVSHLSLGKLKDSQNVSVSVNFAKSCSTHSFIVGMSGMGKTSFATTYFDELNKRGATVVVFDYAGEYNIGFERTNCIEPRINPRFISLDILAKFLHIGENAERQMDVLAEAFTEDVKNSKDFWQTLIDTVTAEDAPRDRRAQRTRVLEKIQSARRTLDAIFDVDTPYPLRGIKEGFVNIVSLPGYSLQQANTALSYYAENIFKHRERSVRKKDPTALFQQPVVLAIEEAHEFISEGKESRAKYWIKRIAAEGRKFGCSICLVSQRPRQLDRSTISQISSWAVLRMINNEDKRTIASCSEYLSDEAIASLSTMNRGEIMLLGEWVAVPTVTKIEKIERKVGNDLDIAAGWMKNKKMLEKEQRLQSKNSLA